jgi:hypothetical protein
MILGGGFLWEGGVGTTTQYPCPENQDKWAHTLDGADIDGERLFSTQPTQPTVVYVDDDEEALGLDLTRADDARRGGGSQRTTGFIDEEDKCLFDAWLATSHDCINGAQQMGKVYWANVVQEYNERKLHTP